MSTNPALWTYGDKWVDFRPLLRGEAIGPISFVSVNRSLYLVDAAAGWFRRATSVGWNAWSTDGTNRVLHCIETASACGLRLQWGRAEFGEFTSTTSLIAVFAGELTAVEDCELPEVSFDEWRCPDGHPAHHCGAMNCDRGHLIRFVILDPLSADGPNDG